MGSSIIQKIRQLNHINRCSLFPLVKPTSVSEHSYHVSIITMFLYEDLPNKSEVDFYSLMLKSLTHDIEEIIISDIPFTVKKYVNSNLNEVLPSLVEEELGAAPNWLKSAILHNSSSIEDRIIKIADMLELMFYCVDEMSLGNMKVLKMFQRAAEEVELINSKVNSPLARTISSELSKFIGDNQLCLYRRCYE